MSLLDYANSVPLPAPVTTGTTIQTFTPPNGEVWVAKNGVSGGAWFRAKDALTGSYRRVGAWTTPASAGAPYTLLYDTLETGSDRFGIYNTGSGVFTAPVSGIWSVYQSASITPTATGQWIHVNIWRQGAAFAGGVQHASGTTWLMGQASYIGPLTAADTCGGVVYASTASLAGRTDGYNCRFAFAYLGTG